MTRTSRFSNENILDKVPLMQMAHIKRQQSNISSEKPHFKLLNLGIATEKMVGVLKIRICGKYNKKVINPYRTLETL